MRRIAKTKVDANQPQIIEVFCKCGWSVLDLSSVGAGVHDILIGRGGINVLVEIKDGAKSASYRKLTPAQVEFHDAWTGPQDICTSIEEAQRISNFWMDRSDRIGWLRARDRKDEQDVPRGTKRTISQNELENYRACS